MWDEPYLESCCRSALHRLVLSDPVGGRPAGLKDAPCLARLESLGFARRAAGDRMVVTGPGRDRHAIENRPAA